MEITILAKAERLKQLATELTEAAESGAVYVTVYAKDNDATSREVVVNISNDDMERDDVETEEIYVEMGE